MPLSSIRRRFQQYRWQTEVACIARPADDSSEAPRVRDVLMASRTEASERFVASMRIGYMEWHDGTPYDLAALAAVSEQERRELEDVLIQQKDEDWRVSEALAQINSPRSIQALEESTKGPNRQVRIRASELLHKIGRLGSFDEVITEGLRFGILGEGLAEAERLAASHPTVAVTEALLHGALCSTDGRAVRFAALLFFLHGKASGPFDWTQRTFFLRFNTQDKRERRAVFDEMCRRIGVDGSHVTCSPDTATVQIPRR
jgi:hypothetical protein